MYRRRILRSIPLLIVLLALAGCGRTSPAPEDGTPHSATLKWKASTSKVRGYHIYRSTDPNAQPGLLAVTSGDVTEYVDNGVEAGRTYHYSVKSVGLDGTESQFSEKVTATIPAQ